MATKFNSYQASFNFFKYISYKTNEYYLKGKWVGAPIKKVPTKVVNTFTLEDLVLTVKEFENHQARTTVKKEAVERFHPNNINNKDFWVECRAQFPLVSVCGGDSKSIKNVNKQTLGMSKNLGLLPFLESLFENSKEKINLLEIGCGYGNLFFEIKDKCNYYGIDYVIHKPLKKYKNFIEIDKSGIPDYLLDEGFFDVVYSVNVLQHCSQKDRFDYFKQGYQALKTGGVFLFTEFLMTEKNKDDICWGIIDESGRGYTQFFNQLTECDWDYELFSELDKIGFKPIKCGLSSNMFMGIIQKVK
jgi:SAM-dependent methyltransferase